YRTALARGMKPCRLNVWRRRRGVERAGFWQIASALWPPPPGTIIAIFNSLPHWRLPRATAFNKNPIHLALGHVLSAVVQNVPGVLAHISGMLASRGYNIDSLAVGETENPDLSRMTFVVVGDDNVLEQVRKQLEKVVTVVQVVDISSQDFIER